MRECIISPSIAWVEIDVMVEQPYGDYRATGLFTPTIRVVRFVVQCLRLCWRSGAWPLYTQPDETKFLVDDNSCTQRSKNLVLMLNTV